MKWFILDTILKLGYLITKPKPRPAIERCKKNGRGLEIGVWYGDHAKQIKHFLNCELFLLDDYEPYNDPFIYYDIKMLQKAKRIAHKRFKKGWIDRSFNEPLDFVYIDANHGYESVIKDIEFAQRLVKHGIIGGHDYSLDFPGVVKAVNEKFKNVKHYNNDWWTVV